MSICISVGSPRSRPQDTLGKISVTEYEETAKKSWESLQIKIKVKEKQKRLGESVLDSPAV